MNQQGKTDPHPKRRRKKKKGWKRPWLCGAELRWGGT